MRTRLSLVGLAVGILASACLGQTDKEAGNEERQTPSKTEAPTPSEPESPPSRTEREVRVLDEIVVTATRREAPLFEVPYSGRSIRLGKPGDLPRTVPEILRDTPSVLVQKTGPGQASPFLRGFTAYRNVFLIDGIRLNNSTFRSGPNQYWSTVDHLNLDRLELVFGPASVLYGSDAIGGAVNAIPRRRLDYSPGTNVGGRVFGRYSSAEDSFTERIEFEGNVGEELGFLGGVSMKSFGDLKAGGDSGELPNTAYDQFDADFRLDYFPTDKLQWTVAYQHTSQDDVPRTHRTVRSVSFHGTSVGSELRRDLDQRRDLLYSRWTLEEMESVIDRLSITASFQRQEQSRDRLRTGGRRDLSGFDVNTWGAQVQLEKNTCLGNWTGGADVYYDRIDSFRRNFRDGTLSSVDVQGPLGDEADAVLFGLYLQDEFALFGIDWTLGVRYALARADADRVDNPDVDGSDPTTPGNVISITDTYRSVVGNIRGSFPVAGEDWRLFFGASQGLRSPSIHDLTSFDATSVFEVPTRDLDNEKFLSLEVGVKAETEKLSGQFAAYYTFIDDLIVRSPTGEVREDTPVVRKDNVGDGFVTGIEIDGEYQINPDWAIYGGLAWQAGQVDQFRLPSGERVDKPIDRQLPLSGIVGARLQPEGERFTLEGFVRFSDNQDRLSLRDRTDTERIPPGGTPGWTTLNFRGGYRVNDQLTISAALENLTDKDYRIHGSGQNEPGINAILAFEFIF